MKRRLLIFGTVTLCEAAALTAAALYVKWYIEAVAGEIEKEYAR